MEIMGRKRKFGEESDFVSVCVPKSKRKEYREAIKGFMEEKFAGESYNKSEESNIKINEKELNGFRKFEEFVKKISRGDNEKDDNI